MEPPIQPPPFRLSPDEMARQVFKVHRGIYGLCAAIIGGFIALLFHAISDINWPTTWVIAVTTAVFEFYALRWALVRTATRPDNAVVRQTRRLEFTEHGLRQFVDGGLETFVPWTMITKAERAEGDVYRFFFARTRFFLVPWRILDAPTVAWLDDKIRQHGLLK